MTEHDPSHLEPTPPESGRWKRLWQLPLLLVGAGLFVWACKETLAHRKTVPFAQHIKDVQAQIAANDFDGAIKQINILGRYYTEPHEQAELEALTGDAYWLAESKQPAVAKSNDEAAIAHYKLAVHEGFTPSATTHRYWGKAAYEIGENQTAAENLELGLKTNPAWLSDDVKPLFWSYLNQPESKRVEALGVLRRYLATNPPVAGQVWALMREMELHEGGPGLEGALANAKQTVARAGPSADAGLLKSWIGRMAYQKGDLAEAQKYLADARADLNGHGIDGARCALLLGNIAEARGNFADAADLYTQVVESALGSPLEAAARLGRARVTAVQAPVDPPTLDDLAMVVDAITHPPIGREPAEMITPDGVIHSLETMSLHSGERHDTAGALALIDLEKKLVPSLPAPIVLREATLHQELGESQLAAAKNLPAGPDQNDARQKAFEHLFAAAQSFERYARLVLLDPTIAANSLWTAASLYDQAGSPANALAAWQRFVQDFASDGRKAEALYHVGVEDRSIGHLDKAIRAFDLNIHENPNSPAAYDSALQMAHCYIDQGPAGSDQAEATLFSLVQNNPNLLPSAAQFRSAIFTLGDLYYRDHRWADAILRLEEALTRYPDDRRCNLARFRLAESYRASAQDIAAALRDGSAAGDPAALDAARLHRLAVAQAGYDQLITLLDRGDDQALADNSIAPDLLQSCYFNRADCAFQRGDYAGAVKLYDQAATRYSQTAAAAEAYLQIVNAYEQMKQPGDAAAAAVRGSWILKRIPDEQFGAAPLHVDRDHYEQMFALARRSS